jgi:uncharacterized protein (DUF1501 family)
MTMLCEAVTPTRRAVLGASSALFAWAFMPKFARAAQGRDARFVTIILRGALDGLTAVPPLGDPDYEGLRQGIALHGDGTNATLPLLLAASLHAELCEALSREAGDDRACERQPLSRPVAFRRAGCARIGV